MDSQNTLIDQLDNYINGTLPANEVAAIEQRMATDATFREMVEKHKTLALELKSYGSHKQLQDVLNETHLEMKDQDKTIQLPKPTAWKKYWPMTAVAASIAFISIVGTLVMTHTLDTKQTAIYKELRRNVEQIKQSQKIMMKDMAVAKEREKPLPGNYAGTGFMISANGYLATSYHVIKEADSVVIENEKYGRLKATVIHSDPANDVSILRIENFKLESNQTLPFTISKNEASLAEEVFTLGFPREDIVFGEGSVSALTGYKQNPNAYQVSVPVNPGNSGGPLLNNKGDLIGIISGIQTETAGAAFAIKSTIVNDVIASEALDSLDIPVALPKQNNLKNNNRVQLVKRWKDFVFMVRVYKTQE
jgi:serine protease Do